MWRDYKGQQQVRRRERLVQRAKELYHLRVQGYQVVDLAPGHMRINGILDVFLVHNQWHDLRTQKKGGCAHLATFVKENIRPFQGRDDAR